MDQRDLAGGCRPVLVRRWWAEDVHHHVDGPMCNYVPILVQREALSRLEELSGRSEGEQPET